MIKNRLMASAALAAVSASFAHAQADGSGSATASIDVLGVSTSRYGGYNAGGVNFADYKTSYYTFGPYGSGNAGSSDYSTHGFYGPSSFDQTDGYSYANPNGYSQSGFEVVQELVFTNTNAFGVYVTFEGTTSSYAVAFDSANGEVGDGSSFSAILFNYYFTAFEQLQSSASSVVADALSGHGDRVSHTNYDLNNGYTNSFYQFYGNNSAFADSTYSTLTDKWNFYIPAYSFAIFEEVSSVGHIAEATNGVPGPAAVAPFAVGMLGLLRRKRRA